MRGTLLLILLSAFCLPASAQKRAEAAGRTSYLIKLKLDFDARAFSGTERVRWVNREGGAASVLYFHLYPNLRDAEAGRDAAGGRAAADVKRVPGAEQLPQLTTPRRASAPDEPRLEVLAVRAAGGGPLQFALEDGGVTLRVQLSAAVAEGGAAEVEIDFRGAVPEIDADETSLPAHVVQQVGAALRETREVRRARDTNFVSRGVMLLGGFHPVLAARVRGEWRRRVEPTIGDTVFADAADYDVRVEAHHAVALFAPGEELMVDGGSERPRVFVGGNLRGFALVAGRGLRSAEQTAAGVRVRSVYAAEHEKVGRRVLGVAAEAARVFTARFGALPFKTITVTEAPLVAGFGSTEFSGLGVIASAFYVDFDSPQMLHLPEIVREQRASVEDSLEFAVAQSVAHQWWGASVGSDPAAAPFLDEALAHWSALLYYQEARGAERARAAEEEQLRGVYQVYRTFGGEDLPADRPAREYRNSFQYAAVVGGKGALAFNALRLLVGEDRFFKALRLYHEMNRLRVAEPEDLREEFFAAVDVHQRRVVARTLARWLSERHGDEDIAPPDPQLAAALGLSVETAAAPNRNALSRLGRFFWRQMTRIR